MPPVRFLVVEDEPYLAQQLERITSLFGETVIVTTVKAADKALAAGTVRSALIIDVGLPDGSGLDLLARIRPAHPTTPAMLQTGRLDPELVNRAFDLRASYIVKPVLPERIERFARSAADVSNPASLAARIDQLVHVWTAQYGLSKAEADVLLRAALGADRDTIAEERQSSPLTIKKHVANLLKHTRDESLRAAVERLLRAAADAPPTGPSD